MYQDIRKQTIAHMKETYCQSFSDRKLNERPYIEVISVNNENVFMCGKKELIQ